MKVGGRGSLESGRAPGQGTYRAPATLWVSVCPSASPLFVSRCEASMNLGSPGLCASPDSALAKTLAGPSLIFQTCDIQCWICFARVLGGSKERAEGT
jgi:hypothetical protein